MKNFLTAFAAFLFISISSHAQSLFTYGTHSVSKDEFLKAFNKNPDTSGIKADKINDYLNMYINFRLKLQAAYDAKLNTDESLMAEADNFRNQLTENFINDQANLASLVKQAFERSQKDILLAQIFIPAKKGTDTILAWQQINSALSELKTSNFETVADKYNTDSTLKITHGVTSYITVFTLPYRAENLLYNLKPGEYSTVYRSAAGYHIFQNKNERPAAGRRKIQQILFATPAFFTQDEVNTKRKLADSVYNTLEKGNPFSSLLSEYGNDTNPYDGENGTEISIGDYNSDFEQQVYALQKPGDYTKVFKTSYGFNIVKLSEIIPVSHDINDVLNYAYLQDKVQSDGRLNAEKSKLLEKWYNESKFKQNNFNKNELWALTDTALEEQDETKTIVYKSISSKTQLFEFEKEKVLIADWLKYVRTIQETSETPVQNQYETLMPAFRDYMLNTYYHNHIEDFNPAISGQMQEFNDANMLFAIMDKNVWTKASQDTLELLNYFNQHKEKYSWNPGASAVIVSGPEEKIVKEIAAKMKANPLNWKSIAGEYGNDYVVDSSRFEEGQFPTKQQVEMIERFQTKPEMNDAGDAFSFVQVLTVFNKPSQRNFEEARGLVINDYQQLLEDKWLKDLKNKYPVKINDAVRKSLY